MPILEMADSGLRLAWSSWASPRTQAEDRVVKENIGQRLNCRRRPAGPRDWALATLPTRGHGA